MSAAEKALFDLFPPISPFWVMNIRRLATVSWYDMSDVSAAH